MAVLFGLVTIAFVLTSYQMESVQSAPQLSISSADKNLLLMYHNFLRSQLPNVTIGKAPDMVEMVWDEGAAAKAQAWANTCTRGHDAMADRRFGGWSWVGQNYCGSGSTLDFCMLYLYDEYDYWNWDTSTCKSGEQCGHFTQIVWHNSAGVGCGVADCSDRGGYGLQLFCNYVDMGNYYRSNPYSIGSPCSNCPNTHPHCVDNLCSKTPEISYMTGKVQSNGKKECVFPFFYDGKLYHDCTGSRPWCSEDVIYKNNWHYCKKPAKPCVFPFKYEDKKYQSCIKDSGGKFWCSEDNVYSGNYHYCGEHEDVEE